MAINGLTRPPKLPPPPKVEAPKVEARPIATGEKPVFKPNVAGQLVAKPVDRFYATEAGNIASNGGKLEAKPVVTELKPGQHFNTDGWEDLKKT